jgi:Suv3 C-terminal domain 1/Mitochondrial degradasome RNA helicase subunit C terminal
MSQRDKYTLCMCPVIINSEKSMAVLLRFAAKLAAGEVSGLTYSMNPRSPKSFADLGRLCSIYNELEVFLWLQQKFPPGNMLEEQAALARKERAIHFIGEGLQMVRVLFAEVVSLGSFSHRQ